MEKIKFQSEDGIIEFFVEEQTTVAGITYLLVSDSQDDEANAYIMKDAKSCFACYFVHREACNCEVTEQLPAETK